MNAQGLQGGEGPFEPIVEAVEGLPGREELERVDRHVRSFVAERPVLAVLLALTAGYVVGRVISRI